MNNQGIIVGLDVGEARTGIARTDALQLIAFPHKVVTGRDEVEMAAAIAKEIQAIGPALVVAGIPLDRHGSPGPQAHKVKSLMEVLRGLIKVEIVFQDERFSTAEAHRVAREMLADRKSRKGNIDKVAATLILQTWLDRQSAKRNTQR